MFRVTEGPGQPTDFTVALTFSLKAFPRFGMGSDSDRPGSQFSSPELTDRRTPTHAIESAHEVRADGNQ